MKRGSSAILILKDSGIISAERIDPEGINLSLNKSFLKLPPMLECPRAQRRSPAHWEER
jgi:hypothetical protein